MVTINFKACNCDLYNKLKEWACYEFAYGNRIKASHIDKVADRVAGRYLSNDN